MRLWLYRSLGLLLLAPMLVLLPAPAHATFSVVSGQAVPIQRGDHTASLSVSCGNGSTPVAGWVVPSHPDDLRRLSETYELGSGAAFKTTLMNQSGGTEIITVTPHVRCLSWSTFGAGTPITTPQQSYAVNPTTQIAEGDATCPSGYQVISGSVSFYGSGGTTILTTAPDIGPGWEARGYHANDAGGMRVSANCVRSIDLPGAKLFGTSTLAGWGTTATANCPNGTTLITAGTWHFGDGGLVTINQRLVTSGATTGWTVTVIQNPDAGSFVGTRVLCIRSANPSVTVNPSSTLTNNTFGQWAFVATDPAADAGFTSTVTCIVTRLGVSGAEGPCTSPVNVSNLAEGTHSLTVTMRTSDGKTATGVGFLIVDLTAPTATFAVTSGSVRPSSTTIGFTIADQHPVGTLQCWLDSAAPSSCPIPPTSDYRGSRSLDLTGLSEGNHVLHVKPTDGATNSATHDLPFTVDTTAPTVTFADPPATTYGPSPTIGLTIADATPVGTLQCWLDSAAPGPCPLDAVGDYRGPRSLSFAGLTEGAHVLHVKPTDSGANTATYDQPFTVLTQSPPTSTPTPSATTTPTPTPTSSPDTTAPTVSLATPTTPFQRSRSILLTWAGQDAVGVAGYALSMRTATRTTGFGAWAPVASVGPETTSRSVGALTPGSTYCFSLTAVDAAGNTSAPAVRCSAVPLDDRSLKRSAGWKQKKAAGWFDGGFVQTTTQGALLTTSGTMTTLGLIAQTCPKCGVVGVYVGKSLVKKVRLRSSRTAIALIVLPTVAERTGKVTVKVLSSGRTVRIDALGLSRS